MPDPKPTADEKKAEKARQTIEHAVSIIEAAWVLAKGWEATGFYDRQDPAGALALHEALTAFKSSA